MTQNNFDEVSKACLSFYNFAKDGDLDNLVGLVNRYPEYKNVMMMAGNFAGFKAVYHKNPKYMPNKDEIMEYLCKIASDKIVDILQSNDNYILRSCARKRSSNIVKLIENSNSDAKEMISKQWITEWVGMPSNRDDIDLLYKMFPSRFLTFLFSEKYDHLFWAVRNRDDVLELLLDIAGDRAGELIFNNHTQKNAYSCAVSMAKFDTAEKLLDNYILSYDSSLKSKVLSEAFEYCADEGSLAGLEYLLDKFPDFKSEMFKANDYQAIKSAIKKNQLDTIKYFRWNFSEFFDELLANHSYDLLAEAVSSNNVALLEYIIDEFRIDFDNLIPLNDFELFYKHAVKFLPMTRKVVSLIPEKAIQMVCANDFSAFKNAAEHGNRHIIEYLFELEPLKITQMMESDNFYGIRAASRRSNGFTFEYLTHVLPERTHAMIVKHNFYVVRALVGAWSTSLDKVKHAFSYLSEDEIKEALLFDNYQLPKFALGSNKKEIIEFVFNICPEIKEQMLLNSYEIFLTSIQEHLNQPLNAIKYLLSHSCIIEKSKNIDADIFDRYVHPVIRYELLFLSEKLRCLKESLKLGKSEKEKYRAMTNLVIAKKDSDLLYEIRDILEIL